MNINIDKVIKGLEKAKMVIEQWIPMFEQYNTPAVIDEAITLLRDHAEEIVSLLKEQEKHEKELPVRQHVGEYFGSVSICPSCEASWIMSDDDDLHFCPHCGQKVKVEHN